MSQTIDAWLAAARQRLEASCHAHDPQDSSARLDAELLVGHVLQKPRTWLYTWGDKTLAAAARAQLEPLLVRRCEGEPIAHILGQRAFWSLDLEVNASTLIPRPDTETLVEWALELPLLATARVLDLGTGTGAIALALASEQPSWQVSGVDVCLPAVELAQRNARRNQIKATFLHSHWFDALRGQFDLIVSNPPYIDSDDPHLVQGDVAFEPRSALVAEQQGMADLKYIISQAPAFLNADGWLLLEHGYQQAEAVAACLAQQGFVDIDTRHDLGGQPRITGGRWPQIRLA
ncbi:peptide chain release factor N(5)-glutamine methyltransferase [Oceanobacter sp. 5_MG-2023]|uniref:peptide chain release factor N(5)-glutamine methyltransferase n=1 Tax=Oceanobacter sp. 5_MG-2023 TaxID=3062645 RepID=UPI0026E34A34|nr:peptide chain release factor N(5)-glutamine methyltransferase [Oceanobacter sp. 5_MG-2023]MDO6682234.1 peptide chain release factor N(5)-glutamine methyltransferase [Oceanobacter sp. 5_MG-2023]